MHEMALVNNETPITAYQETYVGMSMYSTRAAIRVS
jgi:hypothetical protein